MSGIFGVVSDKDCAYDLFYGTDYHSHLGTEYGGLAVLTREGIKPETHSISTNPFRSRFEDFAKNTRGRAGIGVISDYERQPIVNDSHLGSFYLVHVGKVYNLGEMVGEAHRSRRVHFSQKTGNSVNPVELIAAMISQEDSLVEGIECAQGRIVGSSSLMLLKKEKRKGVIYVARDGLGRTPVVIGKKKGAMAATLESCALPNLGFEIERELGPGEIGRLTPEGYEQLKPGSDSMQICAFLWIYFGYPASSYEGINVEESRYRCGAIHARLDEVAGLVIDSIAGIPDSGTGHALGYSNERRVPHTRPFVKYTPTWPRSFMPQDQSVRDLVAKMKLIPIRELIEGKRLLFCEDSIVRGTQLKDTIQRLYAAGAREVHMRPACPPLTFGCRYLNFSRSKNQSVLAARKAIKKIEGRDDYDVTPYLDESSQQFARMVDVIREDLKLTSLRYQKLDDLVSAIGLPREKLCLGCWR